MAEQKFYTPLKVGLLTVVTAYFLFTLHGMFTLSWVGEWNRLTVNHNFATTIFVEDISAAITLGFRFAASIIAFSAVLVYFAKKKLSKPTVYKVARWVLVFEGIYWLGLIATAYYTVLVLSRPSVNLLSYLLVSVIPTVVEAIILPIILFIFAFKLNPNKPFKTSVRWGFITGTLYIFVFWMTNTGSWIGVLSERGKGIQYLWKEVTQVNGIEHVTLHLEHLVSFITTAFLLLALAIYAVYATMKSSHIEKVQDIKMGTIGVILTSLGLYFLWNYLSWVIFAGATFNDWYRWFLGHNMDLWMLSLPLLGLPLLLTNKHQEKSSP